MTQSCLKDKVKLNSNDFTSINSCTASALEANLVVGGERVLAAWQGVPRRGSE